MIFDHVDVGIRNSRQAEYIIDGESLLRTDNATPYRVERGDAAKLLVPVKLPNWDESEYGKYCSVCNQESRSLSPCLNPEKREVKRR